MQEAIEAGADAFFDEKYGEKVRTIRVEGYSHELCGGTHCRATGPDRRLRHHRRALDAAAASGASRRSPASPRIGWSMGASRRSSRRQRPSGSERRGDRGACRPSKVRLRAAKQRLAAGGAGSGRPKPGELARQAEMLDGDVRFLGWSGELASIDG